MNNTSQTIKRGQVYLAYLNGYGCEQRGKRPVVVIQNDVGNKFSPTTIVAPLTSKQKGAHLPVHVSVHNNKLFANSVVLLEQIRVIDKSRLRKKLCSLNKKELAEIDKALKISVEIKNNNGGNENEQ